MGYNLSVLLSGQLNLYQRQYNVADLLFGIAYCHCTGVIAHFHKCALIRNKLSDNRLQLIGSKILLLAHKGSIPVNKGKSIVILMILPYRAPEFLQESWLLLC